MWTRIKESVTTKSALLGMVKANALRLGPHGITVNALLLASDAGSYLTGSVLVVDGGATARSF